MRARSCSFRTRRMRCPLRGRFARIALLGPLADARAEMRGPWAAAGIPDDHVSVFEGLKAALPLTEIRHVAGVSIAGADTSDIPVALRACEGADAILLCLGEAANMSGEAASRACPELPGEQRALAMAVLQWAADRSVPVTAIIFSGRPLMISWLAERAQAVIAAWFPGIEAGNAIADVVTGHTSPSGRTPITWPRTVGQVPLFYAQHPGGRPFDEKDYFTSKYLDVSERSALPLRSRAHVWPLQARQPARDARVGRRSRHDSRERRGHERRRPDGG